MSNYQFNSLEDFIRFCNNSYNSSNDKCNNCEFGNKNAEADENARCADSDIPGGFQDMDPQILVVGTSLLGAILAGKMPFNVQNAVANWLMLLAQSIELFNAQQQYFQGGPGRLYNSVYRNASNPYCGNSTDESQRNVSSRQNPNNPVSSCSNLEYDLNDFKSTIDELHKEIKNLKNEIEKLKNSN